MVIAPVVTIVKAASSPGARSKGSTGTPQRGQDVELSLAEPVPLVNETQLLGEQAGEPVKSPDHALRAHVDVGALARPLALDPGDMVKRFAHG